MAQPIRDLPEGYRETYHFVLTDARNLLRLNLLALVGLAVAGVVMIVYWRLVSGLRGPQPGGDISTLPGLVGFVLVLLLHELIHAAAIALVGHSPRIGAKLSKGVLYATADGALFRRGEFIMIALAPLVVITLAGMALIWALPDGYAYWISIWVVGNASGAVGDLWMVAAVLRHTTTALIRDEEDGIRVYEAVAAPLAER